jgi:N-ethylmaleimide reductase
MDHAVSELIVAAAPLPSEHILLSPLRLGAMRLPNRILVAPMSRMRARADGAPSELMAEFYAQRASSALVISEGTFPAAIGRAYVNQPGLHADAHETRWGCVVEKVHDAGGRIFVQLMHNGGVSHPDILGGRTPVAPSAVRPEGMVHTAEGKKPFVEPRALGGDELRSLVAEFVAAAIRARRAGADGVELHAANGYLLAQFLSPGTNRRMNAYGGSAENRARIVHEVARACAVEIGADCVGVRISPGNTENDIHEHDDETYLILGRQLRELGLAYLHVRAAPDPKMLGRLRRLWPDRLILNQGFGAEPTTREQAGSVLEAGVADAVTIGRQYLTNPDLVRRWAEGAHLNEIRSAFLYSGGAEGYIDYPFLRSAPAQTSTHRETAEATMHRTREVH